MDSKPPPPRKRNKGTPMVLLGVGLSVGVEIAVGGLMGWFVGNWLDQQWGSSPWCMVGSMVLFLSATLFHAVIVLDRIQKRMDTSHDA